MIISLRAIFLHRPLCHTTSAVRVSIARATGVTHQLPIVLEIAKLPPWLLMTRRMAIRPEEASTTV